MTEAAPPVVELLNLGGRVPLMTGASHGVGAGIARRLGEVGAGVVVHYRCDADSAAAVVDAMGAAGSRAIAASAELLDRAARS